MDVLIPLLDAYDVTQALTCYKTSKYIPLSPGEDVIEGIMMDLDVKTVQDAGTSRITLTPKPNLIIIAWARYEYICISMYL